jgi:hypothetical protein
MTTKKRKLNRGLDALLGAELTTKAAASTASLNASPAGQGDLVRSRWNSYSAVSTNHVEILMRARSTSWRTA